MKPLNPNNKLVSKIPKPKVLLKKDSKVVVTKNKKKPIKTLHKHSFTCGRYLKSNQVHC